MVLTKSAIERINFLRLKLGSDHLLHVTVVSGGCSGKKYQFCLSKLKSGFSVVCDGNNEMVAIDCDFLAFFKESILSFSKSISAGRFTLTNITTSAPCRCGRSFL
ncbi:MAG: hypothetical protein JJW01_02160 [Alphaproteobacteria bacterium]|nr:hypothetical protein [Rickettsiales bacterium]